MKSGLIMGTSYLADPEKSADGTKELYLSFVLPAAFLSVSAVEICRQAPFRQFSEAYRRAWNNLIPREIL